MARKRAGSSESYTEMFTAEEMRPAPRSVTATPARGRRQTRTYPCKGCKKHLFNRPGVLCYWCRNFGVDRDTTQKTVARESARDAAPARIRKRSATAVSRRTGKRETRAPQPKRRKR